MSDIVYSRAYELLVEEVIKDYAYPFQYALMFVTFADAKAEGETNRMALALAKKAIKEENEEVNTDEH